MVPLHQWMTSSQYRFALPATSQYSKLNPTCAYRLFDFSILFQGMFIVTFPYAVYEGGYWAVVSMVVVAWICCYTGKILVECLYETDDEGVEQRVRTSYVEVAECVWGKKFGGKIVNCAQIIELLMTCILYILLCGDLMIGSFPNTPLDLASWIMVSR